MKQFKNEQEMISALDDFIYKSKPLAGMSPLRDEIVHRILIFAREQRLNKDSHKFLSLDNSDEHLR